MILLLLFIIIVVFYPTLDIYIYIYWLVMNKSISMF